MLTPDETPEVKPSATNEKQIRSKTLDRLGTVLIVGCFIAFMGYSAFEYWQKHGSLNPIYLVSQLWPQSTPTPTTQTTPVLPQQGNSAAIYGTATIREAYERQVDDPYTTNDESNDQPTGHFGTITVNVSTPHNGHSYTLDADVDGSTIDRLYFPKGGWVDFVGCELDDDLQGECEDENGRTWVFEGH